MFSHNLVAEAVASIPPLGRQRERVGADARHDPTVFPIDPLLAGFDALAVGVALFDDHFGIAYLNESARATFNGAGWSIEHAKWRAKDEIAQRRWLGALDRAIVRHERRLVGLEIGGRAIFAVVIPLESAGRHWGFVTMGRDRLCGALELQMFASYHGLTYAETEVLAKLSLGLSAAEIAVSNGVALSTVRTQITSLRAKTLTGSVRDLLDAVARLPPLRSFKPISSMRESQVNG